MDIQEKTIDQVTIFILDGRVDSEGAVDLDMTLQAAASEGRHQMILNLANVRYLNSAGLRTLADILTQNRDNGGDLKLVALSPRVKRILEIIGFDNFFESYDDEQAAIAAF